MAPVTVREAAQTLEISERAVRKRLEAGTLTGTRSTKGWLIELPDVAPDAVTSAPDLVASELLHMLREKDELLQEKERTLQDLSGRLGYLQSKVEEQEKQILRLTGPTVASPTVIDTPPNTKAGWFRRITGRGPK
jgi:hypothetical protein